MPKKKPSTEATAYHEAGHAVVNNVLGLSIDGATIAAGDESLGHCPSCNPGFGYEGTSSRERASHVRDYAISCYAGLAAEHLFLGVAFSFEEGAQHGAWDDHKTALDLVFNHVPLRRGRPGADGVFFAYVAKLQRKALALVRANRSAVGRVALALIERQTLTGDEVRALCRPAD
jgi:ATP-dependent Zn protease